MTGAPFSVNGDGRVFISWMSQNNAYWSVSDQGAQRFAPRIATPDGAGQENFPVVLVNRKGEVMLVWRQGQQLHWARYTLDGGFTGEQGTAGTLPGRNKHTAFVGADDNFYVVL